MDKEEILKRGREEGPDEREQKIYLDALKFFRDNSMSDMHIFYLLQYYKGRFSLSLLYNGYGLLRFR